MNEKEFEVIARLLKNGWATIEQIETCKKEQEASTPRRAIADILLANGYILPEQYESLHDLIGPKKFHIPGYKITGKIGSGGMATVYKAVQISVDRPVAVKILKPQRGMDPSDLQRFVREIRMLGKLSHPNIVLAIDAGEVAGIFYCVMEFIDGESLEDRIKKMGTLGEEESLRILSQVAAALQHISENGIVHRDIKPSNILLTSDNIAKLTDVGIAKSRAGGDDPHLTQEGMTVGSPHYISPEQARGNADVDIRADIYSLGVTLFQMTTGRVPFEGNAMEVVAKHVTQRIPSPRGFNPALSSGICALIEKMTAHEREERHPDPSVLLKDIEALLAGAPPPQIAPPRAKLHRRSALARRPTTSSTKWIFAASVMALLVVLFFVMSRNEELPSAPSKPQDERPVTATKPPESAPKVDKKEEKPKGEPIADRFAAAEKEADDLLDDIEGPRPSKKYGDFRKPIKKCIAKMDGFIADPSAPDEIKTRASLSRQKLVDTEKAIDEIEKHERDVKRARTTFADMEKKSPWLFKSDAKLPASGGTKRPFEERQLIESYRKPIEDFLAAFGDIDPETHEKAETALQNIRRISMETVAAEEREQRELGNGMAEVESLLEMRRYDEAIAEVDELARKWSGDRSVADCLKKVKKAGYAFYGDAASSSLKGGEIKEALQLLCRQLRFCADQAERKNVEESINDIRARVAKEMEGKSQEIRKLYALDRKFGEAAKVASSVKANPLWADYVPVADMIVAECASASANGRRKQEELTANAVKWKKAFEDIQPFANILAGFLKGCDKCGGDGYLACPKCQAGRVGKCPSCNGSGKLSCALCKGKGMVEHDLCEGGKKKHRGKVNKRYVEGTCAEWFEVMYNAKYLPMKEGEVITAEIDGVQKSYTKESYLKMLQERFGVCKNGFVPCGKCRGQTALCSACAGSGLKECGNCARSGRVKCSACGGKGFLSPKEPK